MNLVWEHAPVSGNELLLMLALADFADDEGRAGASMTTLARKTRSDERTARRVLRRLQKHGLIAVDRKPGPENINRYRLLCEGWGQFAPGGVLPGGVLPPPPGQIAPTPGGEMPPRGQSAPTPATASPPAQTRSPRAGARTRTPSIDLLEAHTPDVCVLENGSSPTGEAHTHAEAARIVEGWRTTFPAARGQAHRKVLAVITNALANGIEASAVADGLARLTADGFVVTEQTLAVAVSQLLAEKPKGTRAAADRRSVAEAIATPDVNPDDVAGYMAALRSPATRRSDGRKEGP